MRIKEIKLEHLVLSVVLIYITLHLLEEGLLGFPAWAERRWGIPNFTTFKWLLHQPYFLLSLGVSYLIYRSNKDRFLVVGLGIIMWGLVNTLDHVGFTVIFLEYSPGLFTGLLFLLIAILALRKAHEMGKLSAGVIAGAVLIGLLNFAIPITLFISVDKMLGI
jgi:hypothetical protein